VNSGNIEVYLTIVIRPVVVKLSTVGFRLHPDPVYESTFNIGALVERCKLHTLGSGQSLGWKHFKVISSSKIASGGDSFGELHCVQKKTPTCIFFYISLENV